MRKIVLASVLALAASGHAFAEGEMQFGLTGAPPAPTPTPQAVGGAAPSNCTMTNRDADDPTDALLSLIASVLALL